MTTKDRKKRKGEKAMTLTPVKSNQPIPTRTIVEISVRCELIAGELTLVLQRIYSHDIHRAGDQLVGNGLETTLPPGNYEMRFLIDDSNTPPNQIVRFNQCPIVIGPDEPRPAGSGDASFDIRSVNDKNVHMSFDFEEFSGAERRYTYFVRAQLEWNGHYVNKDPKVINRGHVNG